MLETGLLRAPEVGLVLPLKQARQAHTLLDQGKISGRIVLEIE